MREINIKTQIGKVHVLLENEGLERTIFWLHGWGMNCQTFLNIIPQIKGYQMVLVDLPGFGESDEPIRALTIDDYVIVLRDIVKEINCKDIILIGHSFGGRVAIRYASLYEVKKIFLVSTKVLKSRGFKYHFTILKYKLKKLFFYLFKRSSYRLLITNSGSTDYKRASNIMKGTLKNIVRFDLVKFLKNIKAKTVVIGSTNDKTVDYNETILIYKNIKNSVLYPFYLSNHFCYLTEEKKFCNIVRRELKQ